MRKLVYAAILLASSFIPIFSAVQEVSKHARFLGENLMEVFIVIYGALFAAIAALAIVDGGSGDEKEWDGEVLG